MKKKKYEKPRIEVVEVQHSECIAGSVQTGVIIKEGSSSADTAAIGKGNTSWDSSF